MINKYKVIMEYSRVNQMVYNVYAASIDDAKEIASIMLKKEISGQYINVGVSTVEEYDK